ncbi:unnamed protein product, partial [Iphiclides podalirius]
MARFRKFRTVDPIQFSNLVAAKDFSSRSGQSKFCRPIQFKSNAANAAGLGKLKREQHTAGRDSGRDRRREPNAWRAVGPWETLRQLAPVLLICLQRSSCRSSWVVTRCITLVFYKDDEVPQPRAQNHAPFEIPYFVSESFVKDKSERALHNFDQKVRELLRAGQSVPAVAVSSWPAKAS